MGVDENILVVDDDDRWCDILRRAIATQGFSQTVKVAHDLVSATRLIRATKFAVAFVDIGLDMSNHENIDGLQIMERIRTAGDETSIIVVTGRSGQDVLPITRDAIKKYDAYDAIGKSRVMPSDIKRLLENGRNAFMAATIRNRIAALQALRGRVDARVWENQVVQAVRCTGGVTSLHRFLEELLDSYLPLVMVDDGGACIDQQTGIIHGVYWSRAIGDALLICFGPAGNYSDVFDVSRTAMLLGKCDVQNPASELSGQGLKGAIFVLKEYVAAPEPVTFS